MKNIGKSITKILNPALESATYALKTASKQQFKKQQKQLVI